MPSFWGRAIHSAWRSGKLAFIEFQHFGDAAAKLLVMVTPGGFNRFFEELSSLNRCLAAPDLVRTEPLARGLCAALCSSLL